MPCCGLLTNNAMQHAAFAEKANSFELLPSNKASNNFTYPFSIKPPIAYELATDEPYGSFNGKSFLIIKKYSILSNSKV